MKFRMKGKVDEDTITWNCFIDDDGDLHLQAEKNGKVFDVLSISNDSGGLYLYKGLPGHLGISLDKIGQIKVVD